MGRTIMKAKFLDVKHNHERVLIIGGGESLIGFDINQIVDFKGAIITVNNVVCHLPRADYWITVDPMSQGNPQKAMLERKPGTYYYCAYPDIDKNPFDAQFYKTVKGVHYLERIVPCDYENPEKKADYSLQEDKNKITTGDSCYGALGLAYHIRAKEIVMLGVDAYGFGHWYNKLDPYNVAWRDRFSDYLSRIPPIYKASVKQWEKRGAKVVNGSPESKIDCFERMTPQEAYKFFD